MEKSKRYRKQNVVNRHKLIYMPLCIALLATFTVSISSFFISKSVLLEQEKQDARNLVKEAIRQIEGNEAALDVIHKMLEDRIRIVGNIVISHEGNLSNDYLIDLLKEMKVDRLYWMNERGVTLYSCEGEDDIGWTSYKGHPLYDFIKSEDQELMEKIRPDSESGIPTKYGAIKNKNGYVVQVGIFAENIQNLTERFQYQNLVEKLLVEENIIYATIVDENLKTIADGQMKDIPTLYNKDINQVRNALKGKISMLEWYDEKGQEHILEVVAPIYKERKITGAFIIGLSMKSVYNYIYTIFIASSISALMMFLLFLWVQNKNVIRPVNQLDENINQIDLENAIDYRLPLVEEDPFLGITISVNHVLDKTYSYLYELKENQEELEASNEEITAAYHQLAASEKELRNQYDEIQNYTDELENLKQKYEHLAYNDPLTNLPNRRSFLERFRKVTMNHGSGAVMLIDLDNFKEINDTLGHTYGDKVLKKVAQVFKNMQCEKMFISRFGGDEFFVIIEDEEDVEKIESYAREIINLFKKKWIIEEDEIYISASIGITRYPFDSNEISQLMMNADMAMYHVKNKGKNNYRFFQEEMTQNLKEQVHVEKLLREAIKEDGFKLLYQPQIDIYTGKIKGFEALLRFKNYFISPAVFIEIAEENGMIIQIGRWVTREAIHQIVKWKEMGFLIKPIAINFSAKQLNDVDYVSFLEKTLRENKVEAKYIEIEVTESVFLDKTEETIVFLNQLKDLGIKIALDDFGTGYSSLSYLTFLPVDKIKLDKSLCDKFLEIEHIAVMDNIISLAHSLNLQVVAEGVEEFEQYKRLKVARCNYIQGYLFSKPLENIEVEKIYENNFLEKLKR
ncbi:MAG: EAL domain-containing protein [Marinisporobacter sp.]|jgi:diguanylate cyclase (GGDEF)-like protein|nr:EAL domain-containing protein [Marinisporobacter sp.]